MSTGNELLYGTTQDTNSSLISSTIYPLQLHVRMLLAVGDDIDELEQAFRHALDFTDLIIVTGGLGPTDDDNTIAALRRIFDFSIVIDASAKDRMSRFFTDMHIPLSGADLKMVEVPNGARIVPNRVGLAPGFIIQKDDKTIIALPGVPAEMKAMMDETVLPFLREEYGLKPRQSIFVRVIGMRESEINEIVKSMDLDLDGMEWGMTAKMGITTVTFTQKPETPFDAAGIVMSVEQRFGVRLLARSFETPEEEVIYLLRSKGMTMAAAESCTGGLISKRITDVPGSSDVFRGGVVAYHNEVKAATLGVSEETLSRFGAVSEETAAEMARGVRKSLNSDIGISVTGIAGPGGGSELKPVGTVCFCLADAKGARSFTRNISGERERVRAFSSLIAVENLRRYLKREKTVV